MRLRSALATAARWSLRRRRTMRVLGGIDAGRRLRYVPGETLLSTVLGTWEPWAQREMRRLVRAGAVCWDVGAHEGTHALSLARLVGPRGRVFALEPHPRTNALLRDNVRLAGARNVEVLRLAAGARDERAVLRAPTGSPGSRRVASLCRTEGPEAVDVQVCRLDTLRARGILFRPDFVKIDVEGFEFEVLEGMEQTLSECRPLLLVEASPRSVSWLLRAGYLVREVAEGNYVARPARARGP